MTLLAPESLFAALIFAAIAGAAVAALVLAVLIVRDWRSGKLW